MYRFHRPWAISNRVSVLRSRHFSTKRTADWRCAFCRVTSLLRLLVYVVDISLNMIHTRQNIKEVAGEVIADCRLLFYCLRTTFTISQMSSSPVRSSLRWVHCLSVHTAGWSRLMSVSSAVHHHQHQQHLIFFHHCHHLITSSPHACDMWSINNVEPNLGPTLIVFGPTYRHFRYFPTFS